MNTCDTIEPLPEAARTQKGIHLPLGLLGFESIKSYALLSDPADAPFHWLQVLGDPGISFLVLSPFEVVPDYEMNLCDEEVAFLGLSSAREALVYNIVTMHPGTHATINLKGPIVVNGSTMVGKQVVLADGNRYSLHHPLPTVG